jgi:hypothetical protein
MKESFENNFKHIKDISGNKTFQDLIEEYDLKETADHLVLKRHGKEIFFPKWEKVPLDLKITGKSSASLREIIEKTIKDIDREEDAKK